MAIPSSPRSFLVYLPVNLAQAIAAFGSVILFTRLLTTAEFGRFALATAAVQIGQGALFFWLHTSTSRFFESAREQQQIANYLASCYAAFLVITLGILALLGMLLLLIPMPATWLPILVAGILAMILRSGFLIGLEFHRARQEAWRYSILESGQYLLSLILGAFLVLLLDFRESGPLLAVALANLAGLLLDLPTIRQIIGHFSPNREWILQFRQYGLPLSISIILGVIAANGDRFLINWLVNESAVGVYAVAYALADRSLSLLFTAIGMAVTPLAFAAMERDGPASAAAILARNWENLLFIALPSAAGLAMIAHPLSHVFVGSEFRADAERIIPWIALASLGNGFMAHYVTHAYLLIRKTKLLAITMGITALANILINLVLLPWMGVMGAVYASVATYLLGFGLRTVIVRRLFPLPLPLRPLVHGILVTGVMAIGLFLLPEWSGIGGLLLTIILGGMFYGTAALAINLNGCRHLLQPVMRRLKMGSSHEPG